MKKPVQGNTSNPFETVSSKNIINVIAFRYLPFWPIFVLTIFVSLVSSYFYIHYQTPIYESNAMILLKDQQSGQMDMSVLQALGVSSSAKTVENELEILKSRTLMQNVVRETKFYTQIYAKGSLRDILVYPVPVVFEVLDEQKLVNSPNIPISFERIKQGKVTVDGKDYDFKSVMRTPYGNFLVKPMEGLNNVYSEPISGEFYMQIRNIKSAAGGLSGALSVGVAAKQSSLILLKFQDQVPARGEAILNALIKVYNNAGITDKVSTADNTLAFINERLEIVTREMNDVQGKFTNFRKTEGFVNVSEESRIFLENVKSNDQRYAAIQVQLDVLDQIEKYIVNKGTRSGIVPSTLGVTDPVFSQLVQTLYAAESDLISLRQTNGENSPNIVAAKDKINQIRVSLIENLQTLRQNLITQRNGIQQESNKNNSLLKTIPDKERKFLDIDRQQTIKNNIYTLLLSKREEVALSRASAVPDSRIVNYPDSKGSPVKPLVFNIYLFGLAIGVIAGVVFVLLREQYNQEVLFRAEIERVTGAPVIGEILHDESGKTLVIKDGSRTIIAEQFRALRTALNFIGLQGDKKTILITSSISGEGKSFTGLNLAVSLALTGKKVAMLEFDLRKPKISKMLDIQMEPGISNYMAGMATYEQILRPMDDREIKNLTILPAGSIPPNPTELMLNGKLNDMMSRLKADFDFILIDSPPIGLVTDAKILNKYVDA